MNLCRYFYAWALWARALWKARTKKHGAGAQPWSYALATAAGVHYIVDGQFRRPPRIPRWTRKALAIAKARQESSTHEF